MDLVAWFGISGISMVPALLLIASTASPTFRAAIDHCHWPLLGRNFPENPPETDLASQQRHDVRLQGWDRLLQNQCCLYPQDSDAKWVGTYDCGSLWWQCHSYKSDCSKLCLSFVSGNVFVHGQALWLWAQGPVHDITLAWWFYIYENVQSPKHSVQIWPSINPFSLQHPALPLLCFPDSFRSVLLQPLQFRPRRMAAASSVQSPIRWTRPPRGWEGSSTTMVPGANQPNLHFWNTACDSPHYLSVVCKK